MMCRFLEKQKCDYLHSVQKVTGGCALVVGPINALHMERVVLYRFVIGRSLGLALGSCISKGGLEGRHKSPYY